MSENLLKSDPDQVPIHPESLDLAVQTDDAQEARDFFHQAYASQMRGELSDAIDSYRAAAAKNPKMFEAYFNIGLCLRKEGKWQFAADAFERAAKLHPLFRPTFKNLSDVYAQLGQTLESETARAHYSQL